MIDYVKSDERDKPLYLRYIITQCLTFVAFIIGTVFAEFRTMTFSPRFIRFLMAHGLPAIFFTIVDLVSANRRLNIEYFPVTKTQI